MAYRIMEDTRSTKTDNRPASKLFDYVTCGGVIITGSDNVFIENLPAARFGDRVSCKRKRVVEGSDSVKINNKAAARYGDRVA